MGSPMPMIKLATAVIVSSKKMLPPESTSMTSVISPHRHHVATVALGDQTFLKCARQSFGAQQIFERSFDPAAQLTNLLTHIAQFEGRAIEQFSTSSDAPADLPLQLAQRLKFSGATGQVGGLLRVGKIVAAIASRLDAGKYGDQDLGKEKGPFCPQSVQCLS